MWNNNLFKKQCIDFDDEYLLKSYCQHHQIEINDYRSLMNKEPTQDLMEHEHYQSYKSWFDGLTETKNLKKQTAFKRKSKPDQKTELNRRFWLRVHEREKERLFYFALAYGQNVVTVKSGEKQAEKEFLGYEWSKRRGHEGMKAIGDGKLVDMNDYNNPQKVNSYIRKNFLQQSIDSVDDDIKEHVSQAELVNMLEFDRFDFNKRIDLISYPDPSLEYTKYKIKRLNEGLIEEVLDNKRKPVTKRDRNQGGYPYYGATGEVDKIDKYISSSETATASKSIFELEDSTTNS
jgi:type I restriction enzyme M protein